MRPVPLRARFPNSKAFLGHSNFDHFRRHGSFSTQVLSLIEIQSTPQDSAQSDGKKLLRGHQKRGEKRAAGRSPCKSRLAAFRDVDVPRPSYETKHRTGIGSNHAVFEAGTPFRETGHRGCITQVGQGQGATGISTFSLSTTPVQSIRAPITPATNHGLVVSSRAAGFYRDAGDSIQTLTQHACDSLSPSPDPIPCEPTPQGETCYPCVRYEVLPRSQVAHWQEQDPSVT